MSSKTEICNLALSHIGMQGISVITEDTPSAIALNKFWVPCRDDVFSELNWNFATVKQSLVAVSDTTLELEWDYIYVYPTLAAGVWYVYNEFTADNKEAQEFETAFQVSNNRRVICSNLSSAIAEYTYKVPDTSIYTPKFVMALSYRLAASAAHDILSDAKVGAGMMEIYRSIVDEAKRLSFSEKRKKPSQQSAYRDAR